MTNWRSQLQLSFSKRSRDQRSTDVIPCVFLAYGEVRVVEESLRSMIDYGGPRLRIDVVHNPSGDQDNDAALLALCERHLKDGRIETLFTMDENISNNAIQVVLAAEVGRYRKSDHMVVTDGDVLLPEGALDEQLAILTQHKDLFACGLRMDATRWSDELSFKKDYIARFLSERLAGPDYINSATGMWFAMFRTREFYDVLGALRDNSRRFTDGNLKRFAQILLEKSWVATKISLSRELNRERENYYAVKTPSTAVFEKWSPEGVGSRYAVWNHDRLCGYTVQRGAHAPERVNAPAAMGDAARRYVPLLDDDLVVAEMAAGRIAYKNAYLQARAPKKSQPKGLYFVIGDNGATDNGIPYLWGDKSVIFVSNARRIVASYPCVQTLSLALAVTHQKEALASVMDVCSSFVVAGGRVLVSSLDWHWLALPGSLSKVRRDPVLTQLLALPSAIDEQSWPAFLDQRRDRMWTASDIVTWANKIGGVTEILRSDVLGRRPYISTHVIKMPEAMA